MKTWKELYEINKSIDTVFDDKYAYDDKIFQKNCIEFLVELGELVNESRCFKYWSIKKMDKMKTLEEYADCLIMILYFFNVGNYYPIEILESEDEINENNLLSQINLLFNLGTKLLNKCSKEVLEEILRNLLHLGKMLNFTMDEIKEVCEKKQKIVQERLNIAY